MVSEITFGPGVTQAAQFPNFFKKTIGLSPLIDKYTFIIKAIIFQVKKLIQKFSAIGILHDLAVVIRLNVFNTALKMIFNVQICDEAFLCYDLLQARVPADGNYPVA